MFREPRNVVIHLRNFNPFSAGKRAAKLLWTSLRGGSGSVGEASEAACVFAPDEIAGQASTTRKAAGA